MSYSIVNINDGIYDALIGNSTISGIFSDRIYNVVAAEVTETPYLIFNYIDNSVHHFNSGEMIDGSLQIDIYTQYNSGTRYNANISDSVYNAIDGLVITASGVSGCEIFNDDGLTKKSIIFEEDRIRSMTLMRISANY